MPAESFLGTGADFPADNGSTACSTVSSLSTVVRLGQADFMGGASRPTAQFLDGTLRRSSRYDVLATDTFGEDSFAAGP